MHISDFNFPISVLTWIFQNDLHHVIVDIVRAVTLCIAASVTYAIIMWPHAALIDSYYKTEVWLQQEDRRTAILYVHLHNFVRHFLPLILLGFPKTVTGVVVGYVIYIAWYLLVRQRMSSLYVENVATKEYDYAVLLTSTCVLLAYLIKSI